MHAYSRTFAATGDIHVKVLPATVINGDVPPGRSDRRCRPTWRVRGTPGKSVPITWRTAPGRRRQGQGPGAGSRGSLPAAAGAKPADRSAARSETATRQAKDAEKAFRSDLIKADQMLLAQVLDLQTRASYNEAGYKYNVVLATLHRDRRPLLGHRRKEVASVRREVEPRGLGDWRFPGRAWEPG